MSTLDEYEYRRGPVRRFRRKPAARPPKPKQTQLVLKLKGGLTPGEKARGTPFDDEIPF